MEGLLQPDARSRLAAEAKHPVNRDSVRTNTIRFAVKPRAPFRLDLVAWALRRRPLNIVDRWDGTTYRRVVWLHDQPIEIAVHQEGTAAKPCLIVTVLGARRRRSVQADVTGLLERMMGLTIQLSPFYRMARQDPRLRALAGKFEGLKPPRFPTVFEALVNGITCQQFTLTAGIGWLNRIAEISGGQFERDGEIRYAFPRPADLARVRRASLRKLGLSGQKVRALLESSRIAIAGDLERLVEQENAGAMQWLLKLRGVGRWTAEYVLLRGLGRLNVFPGDDVGARNQLARWLKRRSPMDEAGVRRALKDWAPYAGFIYFHMLLEGLTRAGLRGDGVPSGSIADAG